MKFSKALIIPVKFLSQRKQGNLTVKDEVLINTNSYCFAALLCHLVWKKYSMATNLDLIF